MGLEVHRWDQIRLNYSPRNSRRVLQGQMCPLPIPVMTNCVCLCSMCKCIHQWWWCMAWAWYDMDKGFPQRQHPFLAEIQEIVPSLGYAFGRHQIYLNVTMRQDITSSAQHLAMLNFLLSHSLPSFLLQQSWEIRAENWPALHKGKDGFIIEGRSKSFSQQGIEALRNRKVSSPGA